jgi:hypothetical protein
MYRKSEKCTLIWTLKVSVVWVICNLVEQGIMHYMASTKVVDMLVKIVALPSDDKQVEVLW